MRSLIITAALTLTACQNIDPGAFGSAPRPSAPSGRAGVLALTTPSGVEELPWQEVDGVALFEGDIVIGDPETLSAHYRGATVNDLQLLWPDGVVRYEIDEAIPTDQAEDVLSAMQAWEDTTSIDFVPSTASDRVVITTGASDCWSGIGYEGDGQTIWLAPACSRGNIIHELGHTLGLWHEQTRPDRDDHVQYHPECVEAGKEGQFAVRTTDAFAHGPYDLGSIMHYDDTSFGDGCSPLTLPGGDPFDAQRDAPSDGDIAAIRTLYEGFMEQNNADERFGRAVVTGDFNGDGHLDLAVGAPGDHTTAGTPSGSVMVYVGAAGGGLMPWQVIDQTDLSDDDAEGDDFGASLAVGDLDADGFADLVVGAPGEDLTGADDSGALYVLTGSDQGLVPWMRLTQTGVGVDEAGDKLGTSVAVGDFDRDGDDDVAAGAPGERPGSSSASSAGYVFTWKSTRAALSPWQGLDLGSARAAGDQLGYSLAAGDLDGDTDDELVVGIPYRNTGTTYDTGAVWVWKGSSAGLTQPYALPLPSTQVLDSHAHFGWSLAVGRVDTDSRAELAVGAPDRNDHGAVYTYRHSTTISKLAWKVYLEQDGLGSDESGDRFGSAVAIASLSGDAYGDLAVGAEGESPGSDPKCGGIFTFKGTSTGSFGTWEFFAEEGLGDNEAGDLLGASLATGDLDGDGRSDLVSGLPGEGPGGAPAGAGAIMVWQGGTVGDLIPWMMDAQD